MNLEDDLLQIQTFLSFDEESLDPQYFPVSSLENIINTLDQTSDLPNPFIIDCLHLFIDLIEIGHRVESFSQISLMIWKAYIKLIKKYKLNIEVSMAQRVIEILYDYCFDGLESILTSKSSLIQNQSLGFSIGGFKLLVFFIQRLSASLLTFDLSDDPLLKAKSFDILLSFYGFISDSFWKGYLEVNESLLQNCFASLMKCLLKKDSSSDVDWLEDFDHIMLLDLQPLVVTSIHSKVSSDNLSSMIYYYKFSSVVIISKKLLHSLSNNTLNCDSQLTAPIMFQLYISWAKSFGAIIISQESLESSNTLINEIWVDISLIISSFLSLNMKKSLSITSLLNFFLNLIINKPPSSFLSNAITESNIHILVFLTIIQSLPYSEMDHISFGIYSFLISTPLDNNHQVKLCQLKQIGKLTRNLLTHAPASFKVSWLREIFRSFSLLSALHFSDFDLEIFDQLCSNLPLKELFAEANSQVSELLSRLCNDCFSYLISKSQSKDITSFPLLASSVIIVNGSLSTTPNYLSNIISTYRSDFTFSTLVVKYIQTLGNQIEGLGDMFTLMSSIRGSDYDRLWTISKSYFTLMHLISLLQTHTLPRGVRIIISQSLKASVFTFVNCMKRFPNFMKNIDSLFCWVGFNFTSLVDVYLKIIPSSNMNSEDKVKELTPIINGLEKILSELKTSHDNFFPKECYEFYPELLSSVQYFLNSNPTFCDGNSFREIKRILNEYKLFHGNNYVVRLEIPIPSQIQSWNLILQTMNYLKKN